MHHLPGILFYIATQCAAWLGHRSARALQGARRSYPVPQGPFDLWVHCASLGEYFQVLPLIQRAQSDGHRVLVTFFSASGAALAAQSQPFFGVVPPDLPTKTAALMECIQPKHVVFVHYDLWPGWTQELRQRTIPYEVVYAQTLGGQAKLWPWNPVERPAWGGAVRIWHQTQESLKCWRKAGYHNGQWSGDGRFDQVGIAAASLDISDFSDRHPVFIAGSTWAAEEALLLPLVMRFPYVKFIVAPHDTQRVEDLLDRLPVPSIRWSAYTSLTPEARAASRVMVVDTLGDLPALYAHGTLALVGGGFGPGLHNILEPLSHGLPIACGPRSGAHWEAHAAGEAVRILKSGQAMELANWMGQMLESPRTYQSASEGARLFISENQGATDRIWSVLAGELAAHQS